MCSMSVPTCNRFYAREANNDKKTFFSGVPIFPPLIWENALTQWYEILTQNTRGAKLSYGENQSLYLTWAPIDTGMWQTRQTDRQTDRITVANMHYSYYGSSCA